MKSLRFSSASTLSKLTSKSLPSIVGALLGLIIQALSRPELAGPNLSAFQRTLLFRACGTHADCVHGGNLAVFAVAALTFYFCASRLRRDASPILLGLAVFLFVASPLAIANVLDPLGARMSALAFVALLAAADVLLEYRFSRYVRPAIAIAAIVITPLTVPFAVLYVAFAYRKSATASALGVLAVLLVAAALLARDGGFLAMEHLAIDPVAGPTTVVAIGIVLFVLLPAALYGLVRFRSGSLPTSGLISAILAVSLAAMGLFVASGDPTSLFFAGEAVLLLAAYVMFPHAGRWSVLLAAVICVANIAAFVVAHPHVVTVRIAQQSNFLAQILSREGNVDTCVITDTDGKHYILSGLAPKALTGAYVADAPIDSAFSKCLRRRTAGLASVTGIQVHDWGSTGMALTMAARLAANSNAKVPPGSGGVEPRTHAPTPTGLGSFWNTIDTPYGKSDDITVLSGFSHTISCAPVHGARSLSFAVANDIPTAPAARVSVIVGSGPRATVSQTFGLPRASSNAPDWTFRTVPLPAGVHSCVRLTLSVQSSRPNVWVTFVGLSFQ